MPIKIIPISPQNLKTFEYTGGKILIQPTDISTPPEFASVGAYKEPYRTDKLLMGIQEEDYFSLNPKELQRLHDIHKHHNTRLAIRQSSNNLVLALPLVYKLIPITHKQTILYVNLNYGRFYMVANNNNTLLLSPSTNARINHLRTDIQLIIASISDMDTLMDEEISQIVAQSAKFNKKRHENSPPNNCFLLTLAPIFSDIK